MNADAAGQMDGPEESFCRGMRRRAKISLFRGLTAGELRRCFHEAAKYCDDLHPWQRRVMERELERRKIEARLWLAAFRAVNGQGRPNRGPRMTF